MRLETFARAGLPLQIEFWVDLFGGEVHSATVASGCGNRGAITTASTLGLSLRSRTCKAWCVRDYLSSGEAPPIVWSRRGFQFSDLGAPLREASGVMPVAHHHDAIALDPATGCPAIRRRVGTY